MHLKIEEKKNAEELSEDPPKKIIEVDPDEDLLHFGPTNDPENEEVPFVEEAKLPIIKEENHSDDELKLEVKK